MTREQLDRLRQLQGIRNRLRIKRGRIMDAATKITPALTGMPGSGEVGDKVGGAAVKLTALEEAYAGALQELDELTELARKEITAIKDTDTYAVLYLRYVIGVNPTKISYMVHMCERNVYRILRLGEKEIEKVSENVIKCQ